MKLQRPEALLALHNKTKSPPPGSAEEEPMFLGTIYIYVLLLTYVLWEVIPYVN